VQLVMERELAKAREAGYVGKKHFRHRLRLRNLYPPWRGRV
jgi:hypothetical protein